VKNIFSLIAVASVMTSLSFGDIYTDPIGDIATGNANLDITQVEVTNDASNVYLTLTVDSLDGDWGKYLLFFDMLEGGSGDNDNPWGRDIGGLSGTDYFVGSWLDGGGGTAGSVYNTGSGWADNVNPGMTVDWASNSISFTFEDMVTNFTNDGISGFNFEVATTGGNWGDPAIDLLGGEGTQPGWGGGSTSTDWMHYEFSTIPAPGVLALFAIAGITRRRRH
jgi:hypothetical protein